MLKQLRVEPDFHDWRAHARTALQEGYGPEQIDLQDATVSTTMILPLSPAEQERPAGIPVAVPHTSKEFLDLATTVAVHRDPERWNLLYRVLYRLQTNKALLKIEIDSDVARLRSMDHQVRRDLHKMHAFVRFRKVKQDRMDAASPFAEDGGVLSPDEPSLHESFVAWYRPDHRILHLAAPFFAERFQAMKWSILTPDESVAWDPELRRFHWFEGLPRESAPAEDELEQMWRTYYASIFNPARLNTGAMRQEMPTRYWRGLPEIDTLPALVSRSADRVETMVQTQAAKTSAAAYVPAEHTLPVLREALPTCKGCDLYLHATQAVPGEGPSPATDHRVATLMLVGEQPGDQEDRQGAPFVGPAGRILDQAFDELGLDRTAAYVTNAVKHFKFVQRGKLRLHQNPRMSELTACRPWLLAEIDAVQPRVVLCLGASAAKSLLGGTFGLMKDRGKVLATPYADHVVATIHPSAVLRAQDDQTREQLFGYLKQDLRAAWNAAMAHMAEPVLNEP